MKIIPIFIPHAGCPYRCVYCDQKKISGAVKIPSIEDIKAVIERNIRTIAKSDRVEIAFFGGTFTLLPENLQKKYLDAVYPYVENGAHPGSSPATLGGILSPDLSGRMYKKIAGIRMSTHPEAVTGKSMKLFKEKGGCLVELGVQSLDRDVLRKAGRLMDFETVKKAVAVIKNAGLDAGVQVMLGLPGDTLEKSIETARKLIELKPKTARIYPALVLKGTGLGRLFKKGRYKPLSIEQAIEWSAAICDIFEKSDVKVIRIGLHPSEDLNSKGAVLAGPYHPAFGEMARARETRNRILDIVGAKKIANREAIEIHAPKNLFNFISGHKGKERRYLEKILGAPVLLKDSSRLDASGVSLERYSSSERPKEVPSEAEGRSESRRIRVIDIRKSIAVIDSRMPVLAKTRLKQMGYCIIETPLNPKLAKPVQGHPDMMLFSYGKKVIYEPRVEKIAGVLRDNGYECIRGEKIVSREYPEDIIYDICGIGKFIIRYDGKIEKNIKNLKAKFIKVKQGYVKCSIVEVDDKSIITSDKAIKEKWGKEALFVKPGYIELPGYKTGFIGGSSGAHKDKVFFTGALENHPDGRLIRDFIEKRGKKIIELSDGQLYDAGSILFFDANR